MARVLLRAPEAGDRAELLQLVRASRQLHRPWVYPPADAKSFAAWLERTQRDDYVSRLACRREDGAIVGVFNLSQLFYGGFCNAYLGYWAGAPYAGQGYMREGLELVLAQAFGPLRLHRVEANVQPGNERSVALLRAGGFREEGFSPRYLKIGGRWRDHLRFAITREDWRSERGLNRGRGAVTPRRRP
ncbi:GNAT family N-acetyltransferase [Aggregicoccus sp. 17bor-14]|uniref:GNAT family N-acetyltransferase n=1 Tax=Myxococcaceae TaxID=31 RepID=UPI00129C598E|nr:MULTISPECIES: GNAT family protein [Myxococcaceae]MBF5043498.1 GNAT family N-acetyltransferase [Simulacricoccus sp. 17bor-14]MRI89256.1 GNAT family N-acetyltransferase [Aggregicoccus sp. 17bor-14]